VRSQTVDVFSVGRGEARTVRFQIMGAFNPLTSGANRTRTYTVTVRKGPHSYQEILNDFSARLRAEAARPEATRTSINAIMWDGRSLMGTFRWNQTGVNNQQSTFDRYASQLTNLANELGQGRPW